MADPFSWTSQLTYTGLYFDVCNPRPEDVRAADIAMGLARQPRWGGAIGGQVEWSVAEHSILVSDHCSGRLKLQGLLHDAVEAYLGDCRAPVKRALPDYRALEDMVWKKAVAPVFGLPFRLHDEVHLIDRRALVTEARDLFEPYGQVKSWPWLPQVEPLPLRCLGIRGDSMHVADAFSSALSALLASR